jgi:hypothetical protein
MVSQQSQGPIAKCFSVAGELAAISHSSLAAANVRMARHLGIKSLASSLLSHVRPNAGVGSARNAALSRRALAASGDMFANAGYFERPVYVHHSPSG